MRTEGALRLYVGALGALDDDGAPRGTTSVPSGPAGALLPGAVFDLLLDIYQAHLVARGLIPRSLADMVVEVGHLRSFAPIIQAEFDRHYPKAPAAFRAALVGGLAIVLAACGSYVGWAELWKLM